MYNLKPTRENFSFNNLFTPTFHSIIKHSFKKRPRRYILMHSPPNNFESMEDWKSGSLEVKYSETFVDKGFQPTVNEMCFVKKISILPFFHSCV